MRGQIIQGESKSAAIYIDDRGGEPIDPNFWPDIEVYLVETASYKTLERFSKVPKEGFLPITFDTYVNPEGIERPYALIRFSDTGGVPAGNIDVNIHLIKNQATYPSGKSVMIFKGKLARMLRAKRS